MKKKANDDEDDALKEFAKRSLRPSKQKSRAMIMVQHLFASITAKPLEKIRLILEAARMLIEEENTRLDIDIEFIEIAYAVVITLLNKVQKKRYVFNPNGTYDERQIICLGWNIPNTEVRGRQYLKPWICGYVQYWPGMLPPEAHEEKNQIEFWFELTRVLQPQGYAVLKGSFIRWAMPQAMQILNKITSSIDPKLYQEMLRIYQLGEDQ